MSQWPPVYAGQQITADLLQSMCPQAVVKFSDQSLASNVTLQNDNALFVPLTAGSSWYFDCYLDYEAASGGGVGHMQAQFVVPSGSTLRMQVVALNDAGSFIGNISSPSSTVIRLQGAGAGVLQAATFKGSVLTGATGGNLQLQWAQLNSNATPAIVHGNSYLTARRAQ